MNVKRTLALFLTAALLMLFLAACKAKTEETDPTLPSAEPSTAATESDPTEPPPTEPEGEYNPLTGLYDLEEGSPTRPIAFMIGNNSASRPQYGVDQADIFVETETEGGITRIMAVFASIDKVPDQIGPIRSARTPFVNTADSLDAILVHCGASKAGFSAIDSTGIAEIDALYSSLFWRDPYLRDAKGYEYSLMTSREMLYNAVMGGSYNTFSSVDSPFSFALQQSNAPDAANIQLRLSGAEAVSFTYDVENNCYYKQLGLLDGAEIHTMADGARITVQNVIVIYAEQYWENNVTINYNLNGGSARLFTGGTVRSIAYTREADRLSFLEEDGSAAVLNPGKTYILIASNSYSESLLYY